MAPVTEIPLTITPEAADYIDNQLHLRPEFERMLDYIRQNVKGLGSLQIHLQPPYELGDWPVVVILALLRELIPGDTTGFTFGDWMVMHFPYQVRMHFVMFLDLEPGHAR